MIINLIIFGTKNNQFNLHLITHTFSLNVTKPETVS